MPEISNLISSGEPDEDPYRPRPVVLLLIDGWGIAPAGEGNAITGTPTPILNELVRVYPVSALKTGPADWNLRYLSLGAGREADREDDKPVTTLTAEISRAGLRQIKISDSERFAALTYFFNGLEEEKVPGEEWQIISISAQQGDKAAADFQTVVKAGVKAIKAAEPADLIVISLSYLDLVAVAAVGQPAPVGRAVQAIDKSLRVIQSAVASRGGALIISSAGGNAEQLLNLRTEEIDRGLTANPVPLIIVGEELKGLAIGGQDAPANDLSLLAPAGTLADVAPTILSFLGLPRPDTMTGRDLLSGA